VAAVARRQEGARVAPLGEESHVSRVGDGDGAGWHGDARASWRGG
jgi:hypothetical protein